MIYPCKDKRNQAETVGSGDHLALALLGVGGGVGRVRCSPALESESSGLQELKHGGTKEVSNAAARNTPRSERSCLQVAACPLIL